MIGAIMMALGHFLMSFEAPFLLALLCLILGSGFLKGNINTQVGRLYGPGDRRRTEAYQVFSIGINLGVVAAPFVCGTLGEFYGWRWGFGAAGVGMLVSLAIYVCGRRHLPPDDIRRAGQPRAGLQPGDGRIVLALMVVLAVVTAFLTSIGQTGSIYLVWVQRYVDRSAFGFTLPATWLLSVTGFGSMILPPLLLRAWRWQAARGAEPAMVAKIGVGAALAALACLVLAALAATAERTGTRVAWPWLLVFHLLVTFGYLYLWPVGMALFSRAGPAAINATLIGVYFLSHFVSNLTIGWLGHFYEQMSPTRFWLMQAAIGAAGALVILVLRPPVSRVLAPSDLEATVSASNGLASTVPAAGVPK
jgi:POT family proton-dependent oligopeptide transporter